jgi:hypothetical protein
MAEAIGYDINQLFLIGFTTLKMRKIIQIWILFFVEVGHGIKYL